MQIDLKQHLIRQMKFSHATFGPGQRMEGVLDHMKKEIVEVIDSGGDSDEWVDLVLLALDGLTRRFAYLEGTDTYSLPLEVAAEEAVRAIVAKQEANEGRTWPDWTTADPNIAIEHDRDAN